MAIQIEVRASTSEFGRYRELVDSDWNRATLDGVLDLLKGVIGEAALAHQDKAKWLSFLGEQDQRPGRALPEEIIERLRLLSFVLREPFIPKMPIDLIAGNPRISGPAGAAIFFLFFQSMAQLKGETGFFQDLQSLLFLNAVHYLLPHLQKNEMKSEHALLANVMHIHAVVVWRGQPAHMFYLLGALMGQLGHKKSRLQFLDRSLSATPMDDHSYLTKVNAYWGELLELGAKSKALDFLLRLSRNVPESYLGEIAEMIRETAQIREAS